MSASSKSSPNAEQSALGQNLCAESVSTLRGTGNIRTFVISCFVAKIVLGHAFDGETIKQGGEARITVERRNVQTRSKATGTKMKILPSSKANTTVKGGSQQTQQLDLT